jgi:hypothetical protein
MFSNLSNSGSRVDSVVGIVGRDVRVVGSVKSGSVRSVVRFPRVSPRSSRLKSLPIMLLRSHLGITSVFRMTSPLTPVAPQGKQASAMGSSGSNSSRG